MKALRKAVEAGKDGIGDLLVNQSFFGAASFPKPFHAYTPSSAIWPVRPSYQDFGATGNYRTIDRSLKVLPDGVASNALFSGERADNCRIAYGGLKMAMDGVLTVSAPGADPVAAAVRQAGAARRLRKLAIVGFSALSLSLAACAEQPKTTMGAAAGAAAGGLLGAALGGGATGIAAGVLLGGLAGGVAGNALDQADREQAFQAQQSSLETAKTGQTIAWTNPDSGHAGTYTPQKTYQNTEGQYCREFQQTVTVGGKTESAYGTACRQPDGTWKVVN